MSRLSVNLNKVALIRNARGGNLPDLLQMALFCEKHGAEGITVHPRPDERHVTEIDVYLLAKNVTTEFNVEGYPDRRFLDMMKKARPAQATLVPDPPEALTSDHGWNTIKYKNMLTDVTAELKSYGIRVSVFTDPDAQMIEEAKSCGVDRIELYTGPYAAHYHADRVKAIKPYIEAARVAKQLDLGINAGHDLNLDNLAYLKQQIPAIDEVSIGQAIVSDALLIGFPEAIKKYKHLLINN